MTDYNTGDKILKLTDYIQTKRQRLGTAPKINDNSIQAVTKGDTSTLDFGSLGIIAPQAIADIHATEEFKDDPVMMKLMHILSSTPIKENGRIWPFDNLSGLYHSEILEFRGESGIAPEWSLSDYLIFILDLADAEFRQELAFQEKTEEVEINRSNKPDIISFEDFQKKNKERDSDKFYRANQLILRGDFYGQIEGFIKDNLEEFRLDGLGSNASASEVLASLSEHAKKDKQGDYTRNSKANKRPFRTTS